MGQILGILADSHGQADTTALAVRALEEAGAACIVHLGDIGSEQVIDELVGHNVRLVFGNCDIDVRGLTNYCEYLDVTVDHPIGWLNMGGKSIAFTHGDLDIAVQEALRREVDYLLVGHTHEVEDRRIGRTRVINPGALFRAPRYTAALLEPASDRLTIIEIPKSASMNGQPGRPFDVTEYDVHHH